MSIFDVRIDGRVSDSLNFFGRFSFAKFLRDGPTAFGTGGGQEYGFYNVDFAEGHDRVEEAIDVILRAWASDEPFSHHGRLKQWQDRTRDIAASGAHAAMGPQHGNNRDVQRAGCEALPSCER